MNIRPATLDDSATLARIQVDSYRTAYAYIFPQAYLDRFTYREQEQDWRDLIGAEIEDVLLVAEVTDGVIAGYALGRPGPAGIDPYDAELVALHMRRAYHRQGIGRALVAAMAGRLRERGCTALMLWVLEENGPAWAFYGALGGKVVGRQTTRLGEGEVEATEVAYGWAAIEELYA